MKYFAAFLICWLNFWFLNASAQLSKDDVRPLPTRLPTKKLQRSPAQAESQPTPSPQIKSSSVHVDPNNAVRINFLNPEWNVNSTKIDAASIILREGATGRLLQLHLIETDPDSAKFTGLYSINWKNIDKLKLEFYLPPQNLMQSTEGMKKIATMIASGQLKRNPFILRRTPAGAQTIEIFDTKEHAQLALKTYRAEQQLQGLQNQKFPSDDQVETAKVAGDLKQRALETKAALERKAMETIEAEKLARMRAIESELSRAQKLQRKKQAEDLAAEAMELFRGNKFAEASAKFSKVIELDPENQSYYFQYGVALYKIDDFNKSIVYLDLASGPTVNPVERNFFIGLNHFRMKDATGAISYFEKVIASKSPDMASSAQFYEGVVYFEEKKWDDARPAFQKVLDTSTDPQLDQRAEAYLEQILRLQQFEAEKARKWQLLFTLGEQYDSNVNLTSDSSLSQGNISNFDGYRTLLMGSVRYRPVYEETREFAAQLDLLDMYTVSNSFQYNQTLRNADPAVATLTLPWTYKGLLFGKGYKFDVTPGYESISMSVEDNTQKEIISSYILNFTNLFVMSEKLYSNFNLELRHDQNEMASQAGDNDSTAYKVKLINSNLHFLTDDKSKILTSEGSYTMNTANGKNSTYNRIDVAVGYIQPVLGDVTGTAKLGYYYLNYPVKSDSRADNSYTVTLGASKKINETLSSGFSGTYNINNSTNDSNTYKKWTAMFTLSALLPL